jgi:biofilm PGA synthesis N-glycosyltransferase PgaC
VDRTTNSVQVDQQSVASDGGGTPQLTLVVNAILYRFQRRRVFNLLGLRVRRNALGFLGFVLAYQMLMSPIAVVGYGQELLGLRRRWK